MCSIFVTPQKRHPERSGSRTLRATQSKDPEELYVTSADCTFSTDASVVLEEWHRVWCLKRSQEYGPMEFFGVLRLRVSQSARDAPLRMTFLGGYENRTHSVQLP